ncbi:MAG: hypothetical protein EB143_02965 [Actinobacteria bacterium]|nr:hypothetical protein [Actinomycetota bacterium]
MHAADWSRRAPRHRHARSRHRRVEPLRAVRPGGSSSDEPHVPIELSVPHDVQHGGQLGANPLTRRDTPPAQLVARAVPSQQGRGGGTGSHRQTSEGAPVSTATHLPIDGVAVTGHQGKIIDQNDPRVLRELAHRLVRLKIDKPKSPPPAAKNQHPCAQDPDLKFKLNAAKSADRIDREIAQLESRVDKAAEVVSQRFDDVISLLERWDYVSDWRLTPRGALLSRVFHESDLLVAETIATKLLDGLDPTSLAALCSTFVYEHRSPEPAPEPTFPSTQLKSRFRQIQQLSMRLQREESAAGLTPHRAPDAGYVDTVVKWASGSELADLLDEDTTPGDFVRTMKQLIDLLRQVAQHAPDEVTRGAADAAVDRVLRGVVLSASTMPIGGAA